MNYIERLIFNIVFAYFVYILYKSIPVELQFTFVYIFGTIAYGLTDLFTRNNK